MHNPHPRLWLYSVPAMVGVMAVLWQHPLADLGATQWVITTLLLGWLVYRYLLPVQMIKRRALLSHVTTESSTLRLLLWNSRLVRLALVITSLMTAFIVLVMMTGLQPFEWYVLFGSIATFLGLYMVCAKALRSQLSDEHRFYFNLRIANRINLLVMTAVLVSAQIVWLEVDDTRYLSIADVFRDAYTEHYATSALSETGWFIGLNAAVSASLWHIMELTSQTESSTLIKLLGWLAFLIFNAIKLGAVWTVLLGIPSFLFELLQTNKTARQGSGHTFGKAIVAGVILAAGAYLLQAQISVVTLVKSIPTRLQQTLIGDPCGKQAPIERQALAAQAHQALTAQQARLQTHMAHTIDRSVDDAFAMAETGVDNFLDWNFSLAGQYTQLWYLSRSIGGERSFTELISERMDSHIAEAVGPGLSALSAGLSLEFDNALQQALIHHGAYLGELAHDSECVTLTQPALPLSDHVHKSLVGSGLIAGPAVGLLALRAGARAALPAARVTAGTGSRAAAKPTSKRILSQMFARLTARAAAGTASGSAGAVCGPFVLACGSAFAVVTWVGMDMAINQIDEAINRQRMRDDLLEALSEQKAALKAQLRQQTFAAAAQAFAAVEEYQNQTFNIRRDGLRAGFNTSDN